MRSQKKQKKGYSRVMNSLGIDTIPEKTPDEEVIDLQTVYGPMRVTIEGDIKNEHIILTYHDVGMNHETCFRRFFNCARRSEDFYKKFTVVYIDAPGQQLEAPEISADIDHLDMEVLATQIDQVLERLEIKSFIGFGVGAGAYILGLYATRNPSRVEAMVLCGAMCGKCGWIEWRQKCFALLMDKVSKDYLKDLLCYRWFSRKTIDTNNDVTDFCKTALDRINPGNLLKFLHGYQRRKDYSDALKKIQCQSLLVTGGTSYLEKETLEMKCHMDPLKTEFFCLDTGMTVIIEEPNSLVEPIKFMLNGIGIM